MSKQAFCRKVEKRCATSTGIKRVVPGSVAIILWTGITAVARDSCVHNNAAHFSGTTLGGNTVGNADRVEITSSQGLRVNCFQILDTGCGACAASAHLEIYRQGTGGTWPTTPAFTFPISRLMSGNSSDFFSFNGVGGAAVIRFRQGTSPDGTPCQGAGRYAAETSIGAFAATHHGIMSIEPPVLEFGDTATIRFRAPNAASLRLFATAINVDVSNVKKTIASGGVAAHTLQMPTTGSSTFKILGLTSSDTQTAESEQSIQLVDRQQAYFDRETQGASWTYTIYDLDARVGDTLFHIADDQTCSSGARDDASEAALVMASKDGRSVLQASLPTASNSLVCLRSGSTTKSVVKLSEQDGSARRSHIRSRPLRKASDDALPFERTCNTAKDWEEILTTGHTFSAADLGVTLRDDDDVALSIQCVRIEICGCGSEDGYDATIEAGGTTKSTINITATFEGSVLEQTVPMVGTGKTFSLTVNPKASSALCPLKVRVHLDVEEVPLTDERKAVLDALSSAVLLKKPGVASATINMSCSNQGTTLVQTRQEGPVALGFLALAVVVDADVPYAETRCYRAARTAVDATPRECEVRVISETNLNGALDSSSNAVANPAAVVDGASVKLISAEGSCSDAALAGSAEDTLTEQTASGNARRHLKATMTVALGTFSANIRVCVRNTAGDAWVKTRDLKALRPGIQRAIRGEARVDFFGARCPQDTSTQQPATQVSTPPIVQDSSSSGNSFLAPLMYSLGALAMVVALVITGLFVRWMWKNKNPSPFKEPDSDFETAENESEPSSPPEV